MFAHARGVCPYGVDGLEVSLVDAKEVWAETAEDPTLFVYRCGHCDNRHLRSLGMSLLSHPALVSVCCERGLDVTSVPHWELAFVVTSRSLTVHSREPWESSVAVELDGDRLELVADGPLDVVETRRS